MFSWPVSVSQKHREASIRAKDLTCNPRKYREKKCKRGEGSSPSRSATVLLSLFLMWLPLVKCGGFWSFVVVNSKINFSDFFTPIPNQRYRPVLGPGENDFWYPSLAVEPLIIGVLFNFVDHGSTKGPNQNVAEAEARRLEL